MNILQLHQSQLKDLPFAFFMGLKTLNTGELVVKETQDYVIVPTDMMIKVTEEIHTWYNSLLAIAKAKGFSYLMLYYV